MPFYTNGPPVEGMSSQAHGRGHAPQAFMVEGMPSLAKERKLAFVGPSFRGSGPPPPRPKLRPILDEKINGRALTLSLAPMFHEGSAPGEATVAFFHEQETRLLAATAAAEVNEPPHVDEPAQFASAGAEVTDKATKPRADYRARVRALEGEKAELEKQVEHLSAQASPPQGDFAHLVRSFTEAAQSFTKMVPTPKAAEERVDVRLEMRALGFEEWGPSMWPTAAQVYFAKSKISPRRSPTNS